MKKEDGPSRRKAPPPRWTAPAPVTAAPLMARNREVEELSDYVRTNESLKNMRVCVVGCC